MKRDLIEERNAFLDQWEKTEARSEAIDSAAVKRVEDLLAAAHKMRRAHDDAYYTVEYFSQKQFTKELAFHEMKQVHFEGQVVAIERCLNILRGDQL